MSGTTIEHSGVPSSQALQGLVRNVLTSETTTTFQAYGWLDDYKGLGKPLTVRFASLSLPDPENTLPTGLPKDISRYHLFALLRSFSRPDQPIGFPDSVLVQAFDLARQEAYYVDLTAYNRPDVLSSSSSGFRMFQASRGGKGIDSPEEYVFRYEARPRTSPTRGPIEGINMLEKVLAQGQPHRLHPERSYITRRFTRGSHDRFLHWLYASARVNVLTESPDLAAHLNQILDLSLPALDKTVRNAINDSQH